MSAFERKIPLAEHEAEVTELYAEIDALKAEPEAWLDQVMTKRIIVHLKNDTSIDGSLMQTTSDGIILRAAQLLNIGSAPTSMAGEVFIPRENIAFAQLDE